MDAARPLPNAIDCEKSVLSSCMQDEELMERARSEGLRGQDFYVPSHAALWDFLCGKDDRGEPVELVTLTQDLQKQGLLENLGGRSELTALYTFSVTAAHFTHHLEKVREAATRRGVIKECSRWIGEAYESSLSPVELLDRSEQSLHALRPASASSGLIQASNALQPVLANIIARQEGKQPDLGLPTGYPRLDKMLRGGMRAGQQIILAGRPGMGKSAIMMNIVEKIAVDWGIPAAVFSCEMTNEELMERLLLGRARLPSDFLDEKAPTRDQLQRLQDSATAIKKAPLWVDDTPNIQLSVMRSRARRWQSRHDIKIVFVDYLQLVRVAGQEHREREVAEISMGGKAMAKELGIPVVMLAQLNRNPEQRSGKPRVADLRESGSIENDADVIGLIYRPEEYSDDFEHEGEAELLVGKNRGGPTGGVHLTFIKELMRFEARALNPWEEEK